MNKQETLWTSGPWICEGLDKMHIRSSTGSKLLASVWSPRLVNEGRSQDESWLDMRNRTEPERRAIDREAVANAELIAASPCLFEALEPFGELATHHAADAPEWRTSNTVSVIVTIGMLRRVQAALAKVRADQ